MAGLQIHREESSGTVTLRLEGTIDASTASLLRKSLDEVSNKPVVLDFSRVREFMDVAVGVLTRGLYERDIQFKGLVGHQERMFRYFGFHSQDASNRRYYTPEELLAG